MTTIQTKSYTEIHGKGKRYLTLKYAPQTAGGLIELNKEQLYGFLRIWGRPLEDPPENIQGRWNWNVSWLDFVQCQFLTDLGFQHDPDAAELLMDELMNRFEDRYPTLLQRIWDKEGLEQIWEAQQNTQLPTELLVVEEVKNQLVPTKKAQQFLNRITNFDEKGIVQGLILQAPTAPGDKPIVIDPRVKSGYPQIRGILIEFIGPVYHKHGIQEVLDMYELGGLTETEAKAVAEFTATHYIEPMNPDLEEREPPWT